MLLTSLKTIFVEKSAPYLSAQKLNDFWTSIEAIINALKTLPIDQASYNPTGSTSSNYKMTSYRASAPSASELPLAFVIIPTTTNAAGVTVTPSWGATAHQVWDMTTNAQVLASAIKANQPVQLLFDGTKFWVIGGGAYLQLSSTANTAGYFDKGTTAPTGTTRLNYSGYMYATKFVGAVWNATASDFAEAFDVSGDCAPGDLIAIDDFGQYVKNSIEGNSCLVGIVSREGQYGVLFGTDYGDVPIAMCGRVLANVSGRCAPGDFLIASHIPGAIKACDADTVPRMSICGMALASKETEDVGQILIQVMRG